MKKLVVIRAPGLSPEQAVRGDLAWTVSDLIADGSYAPLTGAPDVPAAVRGLGERASLVELPYRDGASFDAALGAIRERDREAVIAILSDQVFISQHCFPELKPGSSVAACDVPRLLAAMLAGR
jgi:hypothetical protein